MDITGTTGTTLQFNDTSGWIGVQNKVIKGNISQVGINAPTINIFENTTGATLTPYYSAVGEYAVQSNISLFTSNTMFITIGNNQVKDRSYTYIIKQSNNYEIYIFTYNNGSAENDCLGNTSFEIKIY